MIELTTEQQQAVHDRAGQPLQMTDPATQRTFMLVPRELYDSLVEYDDSPWTDEEMDALAVELNEMLDDDLLLEDDE